MIFILSLLATLCPWSQLQFVSATSGISKQSLFFEHSHMLCVLLLKYLWYFPLRSVNEANWLNLLDLQLNSTSWKQLFEISISEAMGYPISINHVDIFGHLNPPPLFGLVWTFGQLPFKPCGFSKTSPPNDNFTNTCAHFGPRGLWIPTHMAWWNWVFHC